jgi:hypothetical protein
MGIDYMQRRAWLRQRLALGLEEADLDLTRHPAFARMPDVRAAVVLLPADPLAALLDFNGEIPDAIPQQLTGEAGKLGGAFLNQNAITGSHTLRMSMTDAGDARVLAGVARHGGAVAGGGTGCTYEWAGNPVYRLNVLTGLVRIALQTQAAVNRLPDGEALRDGPFELVVALPGATGALLGAFAPGWAKIEEGFDDPPVCADSRPTSRLEIESFPTSPDEIDPILTQAMSRVVNVFGTEIPLYAHRNAPSDGVARGY